MTTVQHQQIASPQSTARRPLRALLVGGDISLHEKQQEVEALAGETLQIASTTLPIDSLESLTGGHFDVVLYDLAADDTPGLDQLSRLNSEVPAIPIVVLTRDYSESLACQALNNGAQEVLDWQDIHRLALDRVLRHALERNRGFAQQSGFNRLKFELVSTASHELRTPLAIIREFVSLVRDGVAGEINDQQQDCLDSALRNCNRLSSLINDLLDLARIQSGKLKLRRRKTDLSPLLKECHGDFLPRFHAASQKLSLKMAESLPTVLCDRDKINQVLINLIGNACKYTGKGGNVTVRAGTDGRFVRIEIQDTGIGINQRNQALIFDAFTQINRQEGPGPKGTGLGLAISKHIVQLHGGTISLQSSPGQGSLFAFTVPVYEAGSEFPAFLQDRLRTSKGGGSSFSLVLLRIAHGGQMGGSMSREDHLTRLVQIQAVAEKHFRDYRDETLLVESDQLLAFLLESDEEETGVVLQRLAQSIEGELGSQMPLEYTMSEYDPLQSTDYWNSLKHGKFKALNSQAREPATKRVLIIDDEALVLNAMVKALESSRLPLQIQATTSGYEGCIRFGEFDPDLVILDVLMPEIDGKEVLKSMTGVERPRRTRFLAVSGHPDRRDEMVWAGCDDFLAKPFVIKDLIAKTATLTGIPQRSG